MYSVFKEAGAPLPRDCDLVDYGFRDLENEDVFHPADAVDEQHQVSNMEFAQMSMHPEESKEDVHMR